MLHSGHRRHPLPSSNHGDGQTNWIKFIPFVCPSQVRASLPTPPHPLPYHRPSRIHLLTEQILEVEYAGETQSRIALFYCINSIIQLMIVSIKSTTSCPGFTSINICCTICIDKVNTAPSQSLIPYDIMARPCMSPPKTSSPDAN